MDMGRLLDFGGWRLTARRPSTSTFSGYTQDLCFVFEPVTHTNTNNDAPGSSLDTLAELRHLMPLPAAYRSGLASNSVTTKSLQPSRTNGPFTQAMRGRPEVADVGV